MTLLCRLLWLCIVVAFLSLSYVSPRRALTEDDSFRDEYLHTLKYGLHLPSLPAGARVGILGGGISGLVAAWLLKRAGFKVTVLEATKDIGGRARTIQFSNEQRGEAGGMRFPCSHYATHGLIKALNLTCRPFRSTSNGEGLYYWDIWRQGTLPSIPYPRHLFDASDPRYSDFLVRELCKSFGITDEREMVFSDVLFEKAIGPLRAELEQNSSKWAEIISHNDKYNLRTWLQDVANFSDGATQMFAVTQNQENYMELSFLEYFRDYMGMFWDDGCHYEYPEDDPYEIYPKERSDHLWELTDGTSALAKAFWKYLEPDILLGAAVTSVDQRVEDGQVFVTYSNGVRSHQMQFDYVINTIPFSILRNIDQTPPFSLGKQQALREIVYVDSTKILFEFNYRFWEDPNPSVPHSYNHRGIEGGGVTFTDLPLRTIYYPSHPNPNSKRGVVLVSYTWGEEADRWAAMPEQQRIRKALEYLSKIHGDKVYKYFEAGYTVVWEQEEFQAGAFQYELPNQHRLLFPHIIRPEYRMFFAGEHTSTAHSWIHAAVMSGIRAAKEVQQRYQDDSVLNQAAQMMQTHHKHDINNFPTNAEFIQESSPGLNKSTYCMNSTMWTAIDLDPFAISASHQHPEEQLGYVVQGKMEVTIENDTKILAAGQYYHIRPNEFHTVKALEVHSSIIEVFSPPKFPCREENTTSSSEGTN